MNTEVFNVNTHPTVSVVIPTFNRPDMLRLAVKSVLDQTLRDIEIIVVDDGSTNDNQHLLLEFHDNRITYVRHEVNKGLPVARNTGIRQARGKFVAFLDDDDRWMPDKLKEQLAAIDGYDAVVCGYYENDENDLENAVIQPVTEVIIHNLLRENIFPPSGLLVRADIIKELQFDERLNFGEDWDLLMRIACKHRTYNVRKPLFVKTVAHPTMTTALKGMTIDALEERILATEKHKDLLGPFWYNYRIAARLLSYIRARENILARVRYTIRRCGLVPTTWVLIDRFFRYVTKTARRRTQVKQRTGHEKVATSGFVIWSKYLTSMWKKPGR